MDRDALSTRAKIAFVLIAAGAVLAALGLAFGGGLIAAGVIAFGGAAVVGGLDSVIARRHRSGQSGSSSLPRIHTGVAAVMFGIGFIIVGGVLVVGGAASLFGRGDELASQASARPGLLAMVLGAAFALFGVASAISRWTYEDESTVAWQRIPSVAVGVIVIVIGAVIFAVGRSLATDPPASGELFERIVDIGLRWLGFD